MLGGGRGWVPRSESGRSATRAAGLGSILAALCALGSACGGGGAASTAGSGPGQSPHRTFSSDEETEDGVALATSRGVIEPEQIRAVVEPRQDELSTCYISRVRGRHWLGGHVTMLWQIDADGAITHVHVADSDLGAWEVEKCLLAVARRMTFPAPRGGATEFTVPFEFSATGTSVPWAPQRSTEAVGDQLVKLDECSALPAPASRPVPHGKAAPAPTGSEAPRNVAITLYVGARGLPQSVGFATADPRGFSEPWAECAEKTAMSWHLPDPRGVVAKLAVRYAGAEQSEQ